MRTEVSQPTRIEPGSLDLEAALWSFPPISLESMNSVSLMRRIDTKYILRKDQLPGVLNGIRDRYAILEIDRHRAMKYASQYFDTATCRFYCDHHKGKPNRTKVRIRSYLDSGTGFLEIKQKNVKGITTKSRVRCAPDESDLTTEARRFIGERIDPATANAHELRPTIRNRFYRLTLIDIERNERITIDWELFSCLGTIEYQHSNLVVIEVKQESLDRHAPIMAVLKSAGVRPYRVSKYCLGMACLNPRLKTNRFKERLLHIDKVTSGTIN